MKYPFDGVDAAPPHAGIKAGTNMAPALKFWARIDTNIKRERHRRIATLRPRLCAYFAGPHSIPDIHAASTRRARFPPHSHTGWTRRRLMALFVHDSSSGSGHAFLLGLRCEGFLVLDSWERRGTRLGAFLSGDWRANAMTPGSDSLASR